MRRREGRRKHCSRWFTAGLPVSNPGSRVNLEQEYILPYFQTNFALTYALEAVDNVIINEGLTTSDLGAGWNQLTPDSPSWSLRPCQDRQAHCSRSRRRSMLKTFLDLHTSIDGVVFKLRGDSPLTTYLVRPTAGSCPSLKTTVVARPGDPHPGGSTGTYITVVRGSRT